MKQISVGKLVKSFLATLLPGVVMTHGKRGNNRIALTFDDGPHAENTPRLLDILDAHGAVGTFFVQAEYAHRFPALVREVQRRGHEIGNHGRRHLDATRTPASEYIDDVVGAQGVLEEILTVELPRLFRPPYGSTTAATFYSLARSGYKFIYWNVDSRDSFVRTPSDLAEHMESIDVRGGDILLFHEDYAHTMEALPKILDSLKRRGLSFAKVTEL
jgi:peptidoglycan/xylan/chitin deacetylase (PgdA/CDA1 family)